MNIKPSKSFYFIPVTFLAIAFIVFMVMSVRLVTDMDESTDKVETSYIEVAVDEDDALMFYTFDFIEDDDIEYCGYGQLCLETEDGGIVVTVDPNIDEDLYSFGTPDDKESLGTLELECAFSIVANEDITLKFKVESGYSDDLYYSTFTYNDYVSFGMRLFLVIAIGLLLAIISFVIIIVKRSTSKRKAAQVAFEQDLMPNNELKSVNDQFDYEQPKPSYEDDWMNQGNKEEKKDNEDFNDF